MDLSSFPGMIWGLQNKFANLQAMHNKAWDLVSSYMDQNLKAFAGRAIEAESTLLPQVTGWIHDTLNDLPEAWNRFNFWLLWASFSMVALRQTVKQFSKPNKGNQKCGRSLHRSMVQFDDRWRDASSQTGFFPHGDFKHPRLPQEECTGHFDSSEPSIRHWEDGVWQLYKCFHGNHKF